MNPNFVLKVDPDGTGISVVIPLNGNEQKRDVRVRYQPTKISVTIRDEVVLEGCAQITPLVYFTHKQKRESLPHDRAL